MHGIKISDLSVNYGEVVALKDVSFQIGQGLICGLIGVNGSGKSSLFKSLVGQIKPNSGQIELLGMSPTEAKRNSLVGYTPQHEAVDWNFPISAREVVAMGRYAYLGPSRRLRKEDHVAIDQAMEATEIADLANRQIGELSGGQKKRVFVARSIAQKAKIILLDEPFAGVDKVAEHTITRLMGELSASGCTILISTHDLNALPSFCHEVILLKNRLLMHDRPETVLQEKNLAMAFGLGITANHEKN